MVVWRSSQGSRKVEEITGGRRDVGCASAHRWRLFLTPRVISLQGTQVNNCQMGGEQDGRCGKPHPTRTGRTSPNFAIAQCERSVALDGALWLLLNEPPARTRGIPSEGARGSFSLCSSSRRDGEAGENPARSRHCVPRLSSTCHWSFIRTGKAAAAKALLRFDSEARISKRRLAMILVLRGKRTG